MEMKSNCPFFQSREDVAMEWCESLKETVKSLGKFDNFNSLLKICYNGFEFKTKLIIG